MNLSLSKYMKLQDFGAFLFIAAAGSIGHFIYEWTHSPLAALFFPVNESPWEHLKLLFFPFLIWMLWNSRNDNFHCCLFFYSCLLSVLAGMLSILILYYTYTGITGKHFLAADILIFLIGIWVSLSLIPVMARRVSSVPSCTLVYAAWVGLSLLFFFFTCSPPDIPLFFPPA